MPQQPQADRPIPAGAPEIYLYANLGLFLQLCNQDWEQTTGWSQRLCWGEVNADGGSRNPTLCSLFQVVTESANGLRCIHVVHSW
jgi:hypothetical protein